MIKQMIYLAFVFPFLKWKRDLKYMYEDQKLWNTIGEHPELEVQSVHDGDPQVRNGEA